MDKKSDRPFKDYKFPVAPRCTEAEQRARFDHLVAALGLDPYYMDGVVQKTGEEQREVLRERLAVYAHEAWAGWMSYLLAKTRYTDDGGKKIEFSDVDRWKRLMETSYSDLKEDEKRSDRAQADKILAILLGSWWSDVPMGD